MAKDYKACPELLDADLAKVMKKVSYAVERAKVLNSPHEGYAYIFASMEQLWKGVTDPAASSTKPLHDGLNLSGAAVRYVLDLTTLSHLPGEDDLQVALDAVEQEVRKATLKHKPMVSGFEAYGVIAEEVDELWELVRPDEGRTRMAQTEALQVAAMGVRYVLDVVGVD
ncbi:hypothetical protein KEU06_09165 [Pseudaminobacter sp. 19-2017]|uniref:Uncharacterized protein n=1 Tax=Pseudaminobacter soli (ex Zhang et al. 2022) TaxID=2831468 RepID=A0A942E089_9HYPH|nr:hypothetical protein [Pseudaminobacter soli]MBS3648773.1 hypothetical protein [Pseudaminobacter soli]